MSGAGLNAVLFLISTLFDFYIIILILRLVLAWAKADYHHPITQFVVKCTHFLIKPLKRFMPDIHGVETAALLLIFLTEIVKYFFIALFSFGMPGIMGLVILAIGDSLRLVLQTLSLALILQAIISWIYPQSPVYPILYRFTFPIVRPFQQLIPPVAGIDISPLPALIILQLFIILIATPIKSLGLGMAIAA